MVRDFVYLFFLVTLNLPGVYIHIYIYALSSEIRRDSHPVARLKPSTAVETLRMQTSTLWDAPSVFNCCCLTGRMLVLAQDRRKSANSWSLTWTQHCGRKWRRKWSKFTTNAWYQQIHASPKIWLLSSAGESTSSEVRDVCFVYWPSVLSKMLEHARHIKAPRTSRLLDVYCILPDRPTFAKLWPEWEQ